LSPRASASKSVRRGEGAAPCSVLWFCGPSGHEIVSWRFSPVVRFIPPASYASPFGRCLPDLWTAISFSWPFFLSSFFPPFRRWHVGGPAWPTVGFFLDGCLKDLPFFSLRNRLYSKGLRALEDFPLPRRAFFFPPETKTKPHKKQIF